MANQTKAPRKRTRRVTRGPVAQDKILQAVEDLFYREGARAVGVDAVAKRAGINKMALYRQFQSKDALLLQYLARMDEIFWGHFERSIAKHIGNPREQLVQFFVDLVERAGKPGFRGCPFVNVAAEFADPAHPARAMVADNKARMLARLQAIAGSADVKNPLQLASALALVIEGAYASSQTFEPRHPIMSRLPEVARALVEHC